MKKSLVNTCLFSVENIATVQTGWRLPRTEDWLAGAFVGIETAMYCSQTTSVDSLIGIMANESWEGSTGQGLGSSSYHQKSGANSKLLLLDLESDLGVEFQRSMFQSFVSKKSLP